jgi:hypothetical protein
VGGRRGREEERENTPARAQPDQKKLVGRTSRVPVCLRLCQCLVYVRACVRAWIDATAAGDGGAHDLEARPRKGQENSFQGQKIWRFVEARRTGDSEAKRVAILRETHRPLMHLLRGLITTHTYCVPYPLTLVLRCSECGRRGQRLQASAAC